MAYFEVSGKGAKTGKPWKARTFYAADENRARRMAEDAGMIPDQVVRLPDEPPSERQLQYARDLGIVIPPGATMAEVSNLIDYRKDDDEPADDELRCYAQKYGVVFTRYMGRKGLQQRIWDSPEVPATAWFVFCLYKDLLPKRAPQVASGPDHPAIKEIAAQVLSDTQVMNSISRYSGADLAFFGERTRRDGRMEQGGSNRTIAYQRVSELLRSKPELQMDHGLYRSSSSGSNETRDSSSSSAAGYSAGNSKAPTPGGCLSTIILMAAATTVALWLI